MEKRNSPVFFSFSFFPYIHFFSLHPLFSTVFFSQISDSFPYTEGARIHAENAIRNHNQALNYLRMSARIDAVAARVQTALQTQRVTKNMVGVCRAMEGAMASMNLEKITEMMDRFENQFENLDVQTNMMESTMQGTTTQFMPENDVNALMQEQADAAGIELNLALPTAGDRTLQTTAVSQQEDDLSTRLAALREKQ